MKNRLNEWLSSFHQSGRRRKGSALILTVGILVLMLLVVIMFAFDARNERKASDNQANLIRARLLAETGIWRANSVIEEFGKDISAKASHVHLHPAVRFITLQSDGPRVLPSITLLTDSYTSNILKGLSASFRPYGDYRLVPYNIFAQSTMPTSLAPLVAWERVMFPIDTSNWGKYTASTDSKVIGAFSYLVQDCTGYLDPTLMSTSSSSSFSDSTVQSIDIRDCVYPSGSGVVWNAFTDTTNRVIPDFYHYIGYTDMMNYWEIVSKNFFPGQLVDSEVFWVDLDNDSIALDTELFPRLNVKDLENNLPGASWTAKAESLYKFLVTGSVNGTIGTVTDTDLGSPWFRTFWKDNPNVTTLMHAYRAAAQLALNIIDYLDDGSHDALIGYLDGNYNLTVTQGSLNVPLAMNSIAVVHGVENTWGVSEIYLGCAIAGADTMATLAFKFQVEVCNPFPLSSFPALSNPQVEIEYAWQLSYGGGGPSSGSGNFSVPLSHISAGGRVLYTDLVLHVAASNIPINGNGCNLDYLRITKLTIKDGAKILRCYPVISQGSGSSGNFVYIHNGVSLISGGAANGEWGWRAAAIKDPLLIYDLTESAGPEIYSKHWSMVLGPNPSTMVLYSAGIKEIDETLYPPPYENVSYGSAECPKDGGTIQHLGVLGRIHSPTIPGESVRLWINDSAGDGSYTDAMLLDMFHSGTPNGVAGRLNPNTSSPGALLALVRKPFHGLYAGGKDRRDLVTKWLVGNGSLPDGGGSFRVPFLYRGEIYKIFDKSLRVQSGYEIYSGIDGDGELFQNPFQEEAIESAIGQIANLLSTRPTYYTIVAAGQSVRDIGNASNVPGAIQIGTNRYGIVEGTYKVFAQVYRDAWTGRTLILSQYPVED